MYLVEAYVEFGGTFPFDMLRYDSCWPVTSMDVGTMCDPEKGKGNRMLVATYAATKAGCQNTFTPERWASFGAKLTIAKITKIS